MVAVSAPAASSISNSLTGFTGESSQTATQGAVAAAGFEFASIDGLAEDFSSDPRVLFTATGARFGGLGEDGNGYAGDPGRNYMRTIDSYAFDSYVAEVTATSDTLASDQFWLGMGSGTISNWGTPDFAGVPTLFLTAGDGHFKATAPKASAATGRIPHPARITIGAPCRRRVVGANVGTHRLRMTLDAAAKPGSVRSTSTTPAARSWPTRRRQLTT